MKYIQPARLSSFLKKITVFLAFLSAVDFAHAQCPVPFPNADADSGLENVPVYTVVTANDYTYFGSGVIVSHDSLAIYQAPLHGTLVILNDSTIEYIPNPGFTGTDLYGYSVCNACGNCGQASVYIVVSPYCPAPVAEADRDTVYNNVPISLNVTANDRNIAGGPLTLTVLHQPHRGTAAVSGGDIVYTSTQAGYVGRDTFAYLIRDTCAAGSNTDSGSVYLTVVTCQPVVAVNDAFTAQEQSTVSGNLAANDLHATGFGNTTVALLNTPKFGGSASVSGTYIIYTAGGLGTGQDSLAYMICTDCGCDTALAIFTVTLRPCSRPTAMPDVEYAGNSVTCTNIFNILANDTIPINGGPLTVRLLGSALYGNATIVDSTLHYTCTDSLYAGQTEVLHYSICNACFCDTSSVTVHITSYPCNGLNPVVNPDSVHVCINYPVLIDVTANDYSPQGLTVTVQSITTQSTHGTTTIVNGNDIRYTPDSAFTGPDLFVYQACDNGTPSLCNTSTVHVYVDACDAPPVVLNAAGHPTDTIHISLPENSTTQYCFTAYGVDSPQIYLSSISPSLDTVTAYNVLPGTSPCIYIAPPASSRAQQTVDVVICSETPVCTTVQVIITIVPIYHAPVAYNDSIHYTWSSPCSSVNPLANDYATDPGDNIELSSFQSTTDNGGQISRIGDSTFCYTPDSSFSGLDTFTYTVCNTNDTLLCTTASIIVTVPVLARSDNGATQEDSSVAINVTANDTRGINETVTICSTPQHGAVVIDSGNIVVYTPTTDYPVDPISADTATFVGVDSFCYTLCAAVGADTSCSTAEVYLVVLPLAKFSIPQGISPNGDGINDFFVIASVDQFPLSQLLVYNRYGDEVWRNDGNGYQNDFGGTWKKNGQPLPDGSYWYIFKFNDGVTHDRMGYIVIQR